MATHSCKTCAKAKRKCGRQLPACQRCNSRFFDCVYPPTKPTGFTLLEEAPSLTTSDFGLNVMADLPAWGYSPSNSSISQAPALALDLSLFQGDFVVQQSSPVWFLTTKSWEIDHQIIKNLELSELFDANIKACCKIIQDWFTTWVEAGSNPFIHSHLYLEGFPPCLRTAYTTLASYIARTKSNTDIVLRIVNENATELVKDHDQPDSTKNYGTLDHLGRVHALLVYQTIALFDGAVRARHLAESRIRVLDEWASEMIDSARANIHTPSTPEDISDPMQATSSVDITDPSRTIRDYWNAWLLAESARRTWHVAAGLQSLFKILQKTWTYCPGGMMFTARQGIWSAGSAFEWGKLCAEMDVKFMKRFDIYSIFTCCDPGEVDEFTHFMLECTYGAERTKQWRIERGAKG